MSGSATSKVFLENDKVIVTEWRMAPGSSSGWHRHGHDYVVVPLLDGTLKIDSRDGTSVAELRKGEPYFRSKGVEHDITNSGAGEYVFIEVELK